MNEVPNQIKFEITNGRSIISVGLNDLGSYFRFQNSIAFIFNNTDYAVRQYMAFVTLSEPERKMFMQNFNFNNEGNFTPTLEELMMLLKPLFSLLTNGQYLLEFKNETIQQTYQESLSLPTDRHTTPWYILYPNISNPDELIDAIEDDDDEYPNEYVVDENAMQMEEDDVFIATKAPWQIDKLKVKSFEEKIRNGERPFAILLSASYLSGDVCSEDFIVDGHHKLTAYKNLNIHPPVVKITRLYGSADEVEFDVERLAEVLQPWQIKHILEHWEEKYQKLRELLKNSASKLHQYVKHGNYEDHYSNGKLKHAGFYQYDYPEGVIKEWYENGKQKSERQYSNLVQSGTWKKWRPSGKIKEIYSFNEHGQYHGKSESYFSNGWRKSLSHYINGQPADGYHYSRWHLTGKMEYEAWYKKGILVRRKRYDTEGSMVSNEGYSAAEQKLVYKDIPYRLDFSWFYDFFSKDNKPQRQFILMIIVLIFLAFALLRKLTS